MVLFESWLAKYTIMPSSVPRTLLRYRITMESHQQSVRLTFRGVGPITRSTLPDSTAEPRHVALTDVLHWLWATRTQIRRFSFGLKTERGYFPNELEQRRSFSTTSLDEHLLLVVAGQFERSVEVAHGYFSSLTISADLKIALRHLRNIYEHWEEQREAFRGSGTAKVRSGKTFEQHFPGGQPWSVDIYPGRDVVVAKVVSLRSLVRELRKVEQTTFALQKSC